MLMQYLPLFLSSCQLHMEHSVFLFVDAVYREDNCNKTSMLIATPEPEEWSIVFKLQA